MENRDSKVLQYIITYCKKIENSIDRFGRSFDIFLKDEDYKQTIAFSIFQIGDLVHHLSNNFKNKTAETVPWQNIADMRNKFTHGYWKIEFKIIWDTAINYIPKLHSFLDDIIKKEQNQKNNDTNTNTPRFRP